MTDNPIQQLRLYLTRWDRRLRLQQSVIWLPRGLMAGLALGVVLAVISRLRPWLLTEQLAVAAAAAAGVGILAALLIVWLVRHETQQLARRFDHVFGLKERVSTSLELAAGQIHSPNEEITARQLADAVARAARIDARQYLPLRLNRRDWAVLVMLVAALTVLLLLENPQSTVLAAQQELQGVIQEQVEDLENLRDTIANNERLEDSLREELLAALDETLDQLTQDNLSREEAVATMAELSQQLNEMFQPPENLAAQEQALQEAAGRLAELQESQELADALNEGALDQAAAALEQMAQALEEMSQTSQQELSQALSEAAEALAEFNPELAESLEQAAEALQQGDQEAATQALQEAAEQLGQQSQQMQERAEQGEQMLTEALQQASASTQSLAQSSQTSGTPGQQSQISQSELPAPIGQQGEGSPGQSSQAGQSPEGEQGEASGLGASGSNESGEMMAEEGGLAGGAGDADGAPQEGGFVASGEPIDQGNNPDGEGRTEFEPVFAPQTIGGEDTGQMSLPGADQPGGIVLQEGDLVEGPAGESLLPYDQVFSDYANAANQALERDYIPLNLRDVVHDYFTLINP